MGFWDDLTWTCHVCGEERPDALISVYKTKWMSQTGWVIDQNVRYCNDRAECIAGAPDVCFVGEHFRPVDAVEIVDEAARAGPSDPTTTAQRTCG